MPSSERDLVELQSSCHSERSTERKSKELEDKLLSVLADEDSDCAEAAVQALIRKLQAKAASASPTDDNVSLERLQGEVRKRVEEEARQIEEQRVATLELLSPRISSLGCAVLIGIAQTALMERVKVLEDEMQGLAEPIVIGATVDEEIDRLRMNSPDPPRCTKLEDRDLLFEELQRFNGKPRKLDSARVRRLMSPPGSPTTQAESYENMSKSELIEKLKTLDAKLKSVVGLVNQFQVNAQLESALHKVNRQKEDIKTIKGSSEAVPTATAMPEQHRTRCGPGGLQGL